ncbi:branched-chain amino acid ABC transporter permease [Nitratireductor indicus]|uniref:Inner-membrane translocator n=1 Tax=Nitratireductor indicus C115 TaxID=1231190 RepID=K2N9J0_9HYPH|nr:branched-chain amino acid ABC transporter permease [Nitratireductor indicus]EKF44188.1 inner-membrane translocator [Nitratireductor indicus C115]MDS1137146.1 branched-chain amino acid ABC transporter permease [Nitratireductor indicus]SFQ25026.1 branched-chain amino acid transport system permease protein [Nitratireductor indicus]
MYFAQLAVNGLVQGLVISLAAMSITLVFGIVRFPNAATGDVMTVGAFSGLVVYPMTGSLLASGIFAVIVTAAVALISHLLVFRRLAGRSVVALLVASIGVGFVLRSIMGLVFGHQPMVFSMPLSRPYRIGGLAINPLDLQLALLAAVMLALAFAVLHLTPIGRQMRAVADNPSLARVSGIRSGRVLAALWVLAGAIAGAGGVMLGVKTVVNPEMGWDMLMPAFAAAIFGGIGSPAGALLAGLILGVVQEMSTPFVGFTYKIALSFAIMLVVLLRRPTGLLGRIEGVR